MSELTGLDCLSIALGIAAFPLMAAGCSLLGDKTVSARTRDIGGWMLMASLACMTAATVIGDVLQ